MVNRRIQIVISRKERHIVSAVIALLIIIIADWQSISAYINKEPEPFIINGCGATDVKPQLIELIKNGWVGVPDYKITLYLQPQHEKILLNTNAELSLEVVDEGIIKINDSYFYILVYDPEGNLRTTFPCFCDGHSNNLGISAYCWSSSNDCTFSASNTNPKFNPWGNTNTWYKNGESWHCTDKSKVCVSENCVPPQTLISGKIGDKKITYSFKADKIGDWKAYVFLYENEYKMREYSQHDGFDPFSIKDIEKRAVAFSETKISVVNEKPIQIDLSGFIFSQALTITLAFLSYVSLVLWLYNPIRRFCTIYRKELLIIIAVSIIVFLLSRYSCSLSCPIK